MGMLAAVKAMGKLFTRLVACTARLRFMLAPNHTISNSNCILSNRLVWSGERERVHCTQYRYKAHICNLRHPRCGPSFFKLALTKLAHWLSELHLNSGPNLVLVQGLILFSKKGEIGKISLKYYGFFSQNIWMKISIFEMRTGISYYQSCVPRQEQEYLSVNLV